MDRVSHFEMPYDDPDRVAGFYEAVFGWQMQPFGEEMGGYVLATTTPSDETGPLAPGAINGGFFARSPGVPDRTTVVIEVGDLDEAIARVAGSGGRVHGEPMDIPGVGRYVAFDDTEGNRVGMLQPPGGG